MESLHSSEYSNPSKRLLQDDVSSTEANKHNGKNNDVNETTSPLTKFGHEINYQVNPKKRKDFENLEDETPNDYKRLKMKHQEEGNMKDLPIKVETDKFIDFSEILKYWSQAMTEVLNRAQMNNNIREEGFNQLLQSKDKFRNNNEQLFCAHLITNTLLLNIDNRLRIIENKEANEEKLKKNPAQDLRNPQKTEESNQALKHAVNTLDQIQATLKSMSNHQAEYDEQINSLHMKDTELQKLYQTQLDKLKPLEDNMKNTKDKLEELWRLTSSNAEILKKQSTVRNPSLSKFYRKERNYNLRKTNTD